MPTPGDKFSSLFRSLGPDQAPSKTPKNAAVQDVEQRWPLFKAVSPRTAAQTPPLSEQDRQRWNKSQRPAGASTKTPISVPSFSRKLAQGLSKISEQSSSHAVRATPQQAKLAAQSNTREAPAEAAPRLKVSSARAAENTVVQPPPTVETHFLGVLESKPEPSHVTKSRVKATSAAPSGSLGASLTPPEPQAPTAVRAVAKRANTGSFLGAVSEAPAAAKPNAKLPAKTETFMPKFAAPAASAAPDNLSAVFNRLEATTQPAAQPLAKAKPSFLRRLGQR